MSSILIVDDQAGIRLLLNEVFIKEGLNTLLAANGMEALQLFEKEQIDCVLLDVKMPGMDGIEILTKIRKSNTSVPIFMMTAYDEQNLIDVATKHQVQRFFTKPFNLFEVRDAVLSTLNEL